MTCNVITMCNVKVAHCKDKESLLFFPSVSFPIQCDPALLPEPNHVMLNHLYALSIKVKPPTNKHMYLVFWLAFWVETEKPLQLLASSADCIYGMSMMTIELKDRCRLFFFSCLIDISIGRWKLFLRNGPQMLGRNRQVWSIRHCSRSFAKTPSQNVF